MSFICCRLFTLCTWRFAVYVMSAVQYVHALYARYAPSGVVIYTIHKVWRNRIY